MARTSKNEKIILTINGDNRGKSSQVNSNHKTRKSEEIDIQDMLQQLERTRIRRNAAADTSALLTNPKHCYHHLAERVRELEKEIAPNSHFYPVPPTYSPYSALTPCSSASGGGFPNYSRPQNFPMSLLSPNSSMPTQRYGLSSKILERAHEIPERFWIDWQKKQMQNRVDELEYIKNNFISPNEVDSPAASRRKSLLLFHELQHRISIPRSTTVEKMASASMDTETSSSSFSLSPASADDRSSFSFDQRSIDTANIKALSPKSPSTLDRSRLSIFLPYTNGNLPTQPMSSQNHYQSTRKSIDRISTASSIEDIAQIDTELKLLLLSQENPDQTTPLLYSQAILNQTIQFRSSKKDSSEQQNKLIS